MKMRLTFLYMRGLGMFTGNRPINLRISLNIYRIALSILTNWCCSCFVFAMKGVNWDCKLWYSGWYQMGYTDVITMLVVPEIRPFPAQCSPSLCVDIWFCFCGSKPVNTWGPLLNSQTFRGPSHSRTITVLSGNWFRKYSVLENWHYLEILKEFAFYQLQK